MSSIIAMDLAIINDNMTKIGYYKSEYVSPFLINDVLTPIDTPLGQMSMPIEFWITADGKQTYMVVRSGVVGGCMR